MAILTHGSDLTLAPTLRPLVNALGGTVQAAADTLQHSAFRSVQLDGTLPGIRPRDLDQRARRDLVGMFTRRGLSIAGLDLFIPGRHFTDPLNMDRAMGAAISGIKLAADLGRLTVSLALPVKQLTQEQRSALVEAADGHSIRLAVHAEDQLEELLAWVKIVDLPALGPALDPATLLTRSQDPSKVAAKLGKILAVVRLNDVSMQTGAVDEADDDGLSLGAGIRCPVGDGDLDVVGYRIAVDLAANRAGPVVLDLRGMDRPVEAAEAARKQWDKAAWSG